MCLSEFSLIEFSIIFAMSIFFPHKYKTAYKNQSFFKKRLVGDAIVFFNIVRSSAFYNPAYFALHRIIVTLKSIILSRSLRFVNPYLGRNGWT